MEISSYDWPTTQLEVSELPRITNSDRNMTRKRRFELNLVSALLPGVLVFAAAASLQLISVANAGFYLLGLGTMFALSIQARSNSRK